MQCLTYWCWYWSVQLLSHILQEQYPVISCSAGIEVQSGWAISYQELSPGSRCVGAGIEVHSGWAIYYQVQYLVAAVGAGIEVHRG